MAFSGLSTEQFRVKMTPLLTDIYRRLFRGAIREDVRHGDIFGGCLDVDFAIDSRIRFKDGSWITAQEKIREFRRPEDRDFTMEFKNAAGTKHESPGEWFKLGAQIYFYGWADSDKTTFTAWKLIDIARLKLRINSAGGLEKVGTSQQNKKHGRASFYGIPFDKIEPAILFSWPEQILPERKS